MIKKLTLSTSFVITLVAISVAGFQVELVMAQEAQIADFSNVMSKNDPTQGNKILNFSKDQMKESNEITDFDRKGNLIVNGGFESGLLEWKSFGEVEIITDSYYGRKAISLTGIDIAGAEQKMEALPGNVYSMQGYFRVNGPVFANVILKFYDALMQEIDHVESELTSKSYSYFSIAGIAPLNAAYLLTYLSKSVGNGVVAYDGISLTSFKSNSVSSENSILLSPSYSNYIWSQQDELSGLNWMDYDQGNLTLSDNGNGTLSLSGTIINGRDANWSKSTATPFGAEGGWEVSILLYNKESWLDYGQQYSESTDCSSEYINWDFWNYSGVITGIGCNSGRVISDVKPISGYSMQIGIGGNTQSCNFGLSTWMQAIEFGQVINLEVHAQLDSDWYSKVTNSHSPITSYNEMEQNTTEKVKAMEDLLDADKLASTIKINAFDQMNNVIQ